MTRAHRLGLLVLLLLGIVTMHGLGHMGAHDAGTSVSHMAAPQLTDPGAGGHETLAAQGQAWGWVCLAMLGIAVLWRFLRSSVVLVPPRQPGARAAAFPRARAVRGPPDRSTVLRI
ncbi:DUF6153 family protein [Nonomuraea sediminis]|uniref:DUF6153 family protein n=1 Tax=Nonomuraea sediminis TaxID=2835864 RepID=UPI001BDC5D7D|nr:DUF6153 family protein [Nonomuraea sediminis]